MTKNYNQLNRKRGGAALQWVLLGFVISTLCSVVAIVALVALGVFNIAALSPTTTAEVIRETVVQTQVVMVSITPEATQTPFIITATPQGTTELSPLTVPTNVTSGVPMVTGSVIVEPSPTVAIEPTQQTSPVQQSVQQEIPAELLSVMSDMVLIHDLDGQFEMGTTPNEIIQAVNECIERDEGTCTPELGEDSYPAHRVILSDFQIEVTEVTYEQYVAFLNVMGPNSHINMCPGVSCVPIVGEENPDSLIIFDAATYRVNPFAQQLPIDSVTWDGAQAYCQAIGRRLPTEAEWERAARGEEGRIYPWGTTWAETLAKTNRPKDQQPGALPVGSLSAGRTPEGIFDMAGNLAEWVYDWYGETYYTQQAALTTPETNPDGPPSGVQKSVRGGSWDGVPFFARTVHRQSAEPNDPQRWIGFRCADDVETTTGLNTGTNTQGTPNPATLGNIIPTQSAGGNAQPTLPPVPTQEG